MITAFKMKHLWLVMPATMGLTLLACVTLTRAAASSMSPSTPTASRAGGAGRTFLTQAAAGAAATQIARTDISAMKSISLQSAAWKYKPSGPTVTLTHDDVKPPGDGKSTFSKVVPGGVGMVAVEFQTGGGLTLGGMTPAEKSVSMVDLKSGVSSAFIHLPVGRSVECLSPDGTVAALLANDRNSEDMAKIQIAELKGDSVRILRTFMPYEGEAQTRTVQWARLVDGQHLLTMNATRRLTLWDFSGGGIRGVWSLTLPARGNEPILSADGRTLVVNDEKGIYLIEPLSGEISGTIEDPVTASAFGTSGMKLALSEDGKMLARGTNARVKFFSLNDGGKLLSDVFLPARTRLEQANWIGDDYFLVNNSLLLEVGKGLMVWKYSGIAVGPFDPATLLQGDGRTWIVRGTGPKVTVRGLVMPEKDVLNTVAGLDMTTIMAIHPGMKVTLDIKISDATVASQVKKHFEEELKKNQMELAEGQPIKLHVEISDLPARSVQYNDPGRGRRGGPTNTTVTTRQMTVAYQMDGKDLWNLTLYSGAPLLVTVRPGETVDSAIRARQAGDWAQLNAVELPKYVPAFRDPPGFGQTAMDVSR